MSADAPPRGSLLLLGHRESMFFHSFFDMSFVHPFAITRQLAEQREAFLLHLLSRQCVRGGSQHEEKLLLTSGGRATVHLVSDCQKYYCSTIIIVRLPEEEKSQAQGHLLT